jgi:uncharacterized protein (TIGR03089 family)
MLQDPGHPRLTWYGGDFERIELSGAVLGNWVNKTTNLLCEEFDCEPGRTLLVDLPPHWRLLTWSLAVLRAGGRLTLEPTREPDVIITDTPDTFSDARELIVVTLAALARRYPGELPPGAVDAAGAVMTYGDSLGFVPPTDVSQCAVTTTDGHITYAQLPDWVRSATEDTGDRTLLRVASDSVESRVSVLQHAVGVWSHGGSVVLFGPEMTGEIADDSARLQRIIESEKITTVIDIP